jgi:APOBEC-like N-terminal domain
MLDELLENFLTGGPQGKETYAAVAVNGRVIGSGRNAADHAEKLLVQGEDWTNALSQADAEGKPGEPAELSLLLNNSPCATCSEFLTGWLSRHSAAHPNVRFILAPSGLYAPGIATEDLREILGTFAAEMGHKRLEENIAVLTRDEIQELIAAIPSFGGVRTQGPDPDKATSRDHLRSLAGAGWDLHQLQMQSPQKPRQAELARRIGQVRKEIEKALEAKGKVGTPTT